MTANQAGLQELMHSRAEALREQTQLDKRDRWGPLHHGCADQAASLQCLVCAQVLEGKATGTGWQMHAVLARRRLPALLTANAQ